MPCFVYFPSLPIWHYWHYSCTFLCCNSLTGCYTRDPPLAAKQPLCSTWPCPLRSGLPPEAPGSTREPPGPLPGHSLSTSWNRLLFGCHFSHQNATKWHHAGTPKLPKNNRALRRPKSESVHTLPHKKNVKGRRAPTSHQKNAPKKYNNSDRVVVSLFVHFCTSFGIPKPPPCTQKRPRTPQESP